MVIVMFACSEKAYLLMQELKQKWISVHPEDEVFDFVKCSALPEIAVKNSIPEVTGEWFLKADALVYLSAAGIAVRSIAPYLKHKAKDPAVLVIDETGKFCISLLSGHAGGANALAGEMAELLKERGTIPVITTATDREGRFAVDDFARRNHLLLKDWELAKKISVSVLQGEKIGVTSDFAIYGEAPEELKEASKDFWRLSKAEKPGLGIWISCRKEDAPYKETLQLIPRSLVVGIGCRKGMPEEKIEEAISQCFSKEGLLTEGIAAIASIDLKKQEQGIFAYCERNKLPFLVYSKEELMQVEGTFTSSSFVEEITGVDNVCERSAVLGAIRLAGKAGRLLFHKKCYEGVTVAAAEMAKKIYYS